MRIIFLGTPEFAIESLDMLVNSHHQVVAVVTQPDKPNARGNKIEPSAVKVYAVEHNIPVYQFVKISRDGIDILKDLKPDLMITAAYGQILSQQVIDIPRHGIINVHASLLPKYRGASPIQSAIIAGETKTGITIMQTDIGLDTGDILCQKEIEILPTDTAGDLSAKLSALGAGMLLETVNAIEEGREIHIKQNHSAATFTKKISKADCVINWNKSANQIRSLVMGANPDPIATTEVGGQVLKIYTASVATIDSSEDALPGTILGSSSAKAGVFVETGSGIISLGLVQLPGGKVLEAKQLISGRKLKVGDVCKQNLQAEN
ncbi:MAG: methionyl-tRNA formyltransferase [Clostridia bacterium]|nr:methionyl-tRNA formyltransferase [Clostridia bacterium]